jgi:glycosyltransferase involved in cell wall biosynthesis
MMPASPSSGQGPVVSALVPAYRAEAFLGRTLEALAAQTYPHLEILVADDASPDATLEVARSFARDRDDVTVLEREANLGWLRNTNDLMERARGELMFFAFHDDLVEPTYVERLVTALEAHPNAVLAYSDMTVTETSGERHTHTFRLVEGRSSAACRGWVMAARPHEWWVPNRGVFRATAFRAVGGIHPNAAGEFAADWPWLLHLSLLGPFVRVPEVLCHKYYTGASISRQWRWTREQQEALDQAGLDEVSASSVPRVTRTVVLAGLHLRRSLRRARLRWGGQHTSSTEAAPRRAERDLRGTVLDRVRETRVRARPFVEGARRAGLGPDPDRRRSHGDRAAIRDVRRAMDLPRERPRNRRSGEVWAVGLVRNAGDLLPPVLDHLERQGVDRLLVVDNLSEDDTWDELTTRSLGGRVLAGRDTLRSDNESHKVSHLARWAWRRGADWVVPFRADEFWFGLDDDLATTVRGAGADVLTARVHEAFPSADGLWMVDAAPHPHRIRVAFRASSSVTVAEGDRPLAAHPWAGQPSEVLRVLRLPWRSFEQFDRELAEGIHSHAGWGWQPDAPNTRHDAGVPTPGQRRDLWESLLRGEAVETLDRTPSAPLVSLDPGRLLGARSWRELGLG